MKAPHMNHNREYQTLLNNLPGGVQQCLNDEYFTLVEVNQGFVNLFGFSKEELKDCFDNRFIRMVHPEDRARLLTDVSSMAGRCEKTLFQYRVLCSDGSYKWIMDNAQLIHNENGEDRLFCIMMDVTEAKNAREELRLSLELHEIIMDQTTEILFVWDFQSDTINFSSNWEKRFGYPPSFHGLSNPAMFRNIHPDDAVSLADVMLAVKKGTAFSMKEARVRTANGSYIWCRFRATTQYDEAGTPLKAVGVISDIDKEKRMIDDLRQRAERDALTGLYNRAETERLIRQHLKEHPNEICALITIDTDNFKSINDTHGHVFGDAVLSELAVCMKKLTDASDIVGRIGGDEFTILLKNLSSREIAARKVAELLHLTEQQFKQSKRLADITCSAGAAMFPEDGADYLSLYQCADQALYQAKSQGKNQYVLYQKARTPAVEQMGYSALGAAIDSDQSTGGMPNDLISYVFHVLYDTNDVNHVVHLILEIIGKRFDVSRAYVFENSTDDNYCDNTFEWCNEGIAPEKDNFQHFPYDAAEGYQDLFKDKSIFYCQDIHTLPPHITAIFARQQIHSTLQCAILEDNRFRGFIGFDECTGVRTWTREEIDTLSIISKLLTVFLLKKRAVDREHEQANRLNTILDTQNAYIYAIEKDTRNLLYLNHKTRTLDPKAQVGTTCYAAFFGRKEPCETCPLTSGAGEIYNPRYNVWTMAQAAPMKWGDMDAYLISCFDITRYKKVQKQEIR